MATSTKAHLLLVGDIHSKVDKIHRMASWLARKPLKLDLTILCGDLTNVEHPNPKYTAQSPAPSPPTSTAKRRHIDPVPENPQREVTKVLLNSIHKFAEDAAQKRKAQEESEFMAVLEALHTISKNVLYIPGNHDPTDAFPDQYLRRIRSSPPSTLNRPVLVGSTAKDMTTKDTDLPLWQRAEKKFGTLNFHQRMVRVGPRIKADPEIDLYAGYPYTEEMIVRGVKKLFTGERNFISAPNDMIRLKGRLPGNAVEDPDKCILVTHCGPGGVGTTDDNKTPHQAATTRLETGSAQLTDLLSSPEFQGVTDENAKSPNSPLQRSPFSPKPGSPKQQSPNILFHLHGHSHSAWGISHIGNIPVINAGALKDGRFAIATVEYGLGLGMVKRWELKGVEFGWV
ncbi:hypothetical protein HDV00_011298 [Rhizophlyctis rosea]|nr:hypothetical protein HDV00_011298 [Rhizophlyctis rosea]